MQKTLRSTPLLFAALALAVGSVLACSSNEDTAGPAEGSAGHAAVAGGGGTTAGSGAHAGAAGASGKANGGAYQGGSAGAGGSFGQGSGASAGSAAVAGHAGVGGGGGTAGAPGGSGGAGSVGAGGTAAGGSNVGGGGGSSGNGNGNGGAGGVVTPDPFPGSKRFDITAPSDRLFWKKQLHDPHHAMQGFAVDQKNGRMYFAQLKDKGSGADLCITETDFTGKETGHMYHDAAGHGVSIGVESVGKASYLWVETDADKDAEGGRGTALLRFKFEDGKKPAGTKHFKGSDTITAATDPINERIVIRRKESNGMTFRLFSFADAVKEDFSKQLVKFVQPDLANPNPVFQGYTIYGQYLYTLDGEGHDDPAKIDSHVTRIDMKTGKREARFLTKAGESLNYREPEGMAVYKAGNTMRLCMGFASRPDGGGADRFANVYFKDVLEP